MTETPSAPTLYEEAMSLLGRGDISAAIPKLSFCLNDDFFNDEILFLLGACFTQCGMHGLSAVISSAAIESRGGQKKKPFPEALMNLGAAYKAEHQNDEAERIWNAALKYETVPSSRAKLFVNMATLFINEGCPERALPYCEESFSRKTRPTLGRKSREAWRVLSWGGGRKVSRVGRRPTRQVIAIGGHTRTSPNRDGSPDKTLIVWGDQGVGDELFYGTALRDVAAMSKRIILDCHPRLDKLFARSFPEFEVHGTRKDLTELAWFEGCDADAAVALADLPCFLRTDGNWDDRPYLRTQDYPDDPLLNSEGPRIGLSWTGGSKKTRTELRSLALPLLEPILKARPDARWYSLQYTPDAAREVCALEEQTGIRISHYPSWVECRDYDRTASFVASLDLVITVNTTVHHLGGALGVPTWTLTPSRPSWRYLVKGDTVPWYSSIKLYRQENDGEWDAPIARVAADLEGVFR